MAKISEMDWAQYINMDYAQNLKKDPPDAKQTTFIKYKEDPTCLFSKRSPFNIMLYY